MDARHYYFPNHGMGDYFQSTSSHWPLSHIRSSVKSQDDSESDRIDTFEMDWVEDQPIPIPYQERTIKNLTGRSLYESFARSRRRRSSTCSGSSPDVREPHKEGCPSLDKSATTSRLVDQVMSATTSDAKIEEAKQTPAQIGSHACKQCNMCDSDLHRHNQKQIVIQNNLPRSCTNVKAATMSMSVDSIPSSPRSLSIQHQKMSLSPDQQPKTHESEPTILSSPQVHIYAQDGTVDQHVPQSSTALPPSERSGDESDTLKDGESSPATKVKKQKQKSNQQGSHICKLCDITFTRHFDLLRHNQKHQIEPEEDMARRTCTNCDSVLSRVDATKRHVDTLPESCNYLRRKQGLRSLPAMPAEYYDACREQYHKLAQERRKPKGRKKANPAA